MAVEARLAVLMKLAAPEVESRQNALLARLGLPTRLPDVAQAALLELVTHDKKVFGDAPRWILPTAVGKAVVSSTVAPEVVRAALEACGTVTAA
jgi:3-dehydroquinate synthetase